jgi:hypothetical protein
VPAAGADAVDVDDGEALQGAGKGVLHALVVGGFGSRIIPHRR